MGLIQDFRRWLSRRTIARTHSRFGPVRVFEETRGNDRMRILSVDGTYQSASYVDDRWCCVPFEYLRRFFVIFELGIPMQRVCMLGGGAYAFPKDLIAHHPQVQLDVVEIDPTITQLAREYFFLDRLIQTYQTEQSGLLKLIQDDALAHLQACAEEGCRYGAIINDCFAAEVPPEQLFSPQAARLVRQCLSPRGVYLINTIASFDEGPSVALMELTDVLSREFTQLYALPCAHASGDECYNMVVIAANEHLPLHDAITLFGSGS